MTAKQIYDIFKNTQPEYLNEVQTYKEVRGSNNTIELVMTNARFGRFTVERGHYILEISDKKEW